MRCHCFGGVSAYAIDKDKYEVVPIGITKEGRWVTSGDAQRLLTETGGRRAPPLHRRICAQRSRDYARGSGSGQWRVGVVPPERFIARAALCHSKLTRRWLGGRTRGHQRRCDLPVLHAHSVKMDDSGTAELGGIPYVGAACWVGAGMDRTS